jgi:hypothetical protein
VAQQSTSNISAIFTLKKTKSDSVACQFFSKAKTAYGRSFVVSKRYAGKSVRFKRFGTGFGLCHAVGSAWRVAQSMNRILLALLLLGLVALTTPSARADLMYGLSSGGTPGTSSTVYRIDTTTGAATPVVNLTGTAYTSLVDISFLNGILYATDVNVGGAFGFSFGTINLTTGAYTKINNQGGSQNWQGLAAIASQNLLYTVDLDSSGEQLLSVTPSGIIHTIGPTNSDIGDLAYDSTDNILYGINSSSDTLVTIDPSTGNTTTVGALGNLSPAFLYPGLGWDGNSDTLYLNVGYTNNFYSVNRSTGAATLIGGNGTTDIIDGLADIQAVPEPTSVLLLMTVLLGAGHKIRRRGPASSLIRRLPPYDRSVTRPWPRNSRTDS